MPGSELVDEFSLDELSILILTNDGLGPMPLSHQNAFQRFLKKSWLVGSNRKKNVFYPESTYVLTTKEIYIWGIIISKILETNPELTEDDIIDEYRQLLKRKSWYFDNFYKEQRFFNSINTKNMRIVFDDLLYGLERRFGIALNKEDLDLAEKRAFESLIKRGLIEDPIFTTFLGFSIAVAGFIPFGFTKKKRKGRTIYYKIEAVFWSYMQEENIRGTRTTKINFRLWRILTAFKKALAETTSETIDKK